MLGFGSSLHGHTVTVSRSTQGDPDGDGVPAVVDGQPLVLEGCNVQPSSTGQVVDAGVHVSTTYRVSVAGVDLGVAAGARVTWRRPGTWFVVGDPQEYWGALPHTEFQISTERG